MHMAVWRHVCIGRCVSACCISVLCIVGCCGLVTVAVSLEGVSLSLHFAHIALACMHQASAWAYVSMGLAGGGSGAICVHEPVCVCLPGDKTWGEP